MIGNEWDDLIAKLCRPGATWKKGRMLTYAKLLPIPKAWASFVIQMLESTSCTSEIPLRRVFTVSAILDKKPINVGELIANNIHEIATGKKTVLEHKSIINWLCKKQRVEEFEDDLYTPTVQPITNKTMDMFVKKYEEFVRERERRSHLRHHHNSSHLKWSKERVAIMVLILLFTPMMLEYMFTSADWMNETSDQLWLNRPRFSPKFAAEAQMHRRPITGSYGRFDSSREHMYQYFLKGFFEGEKREGDGFFEGLLEAGNPSTWVLTLLCEGLKVLVSSFPRSKGSYIKEREEHEIISLWLNALSKSMQHLLWKSHKLFLCTQRLRVTTLRLSLHYSAEP